MPSLVSDGQLLRCNLYTQPEPSRWSLLSKCLNCQLKARADEAEAAGKAKGAAIAQVKAEKDAEIAQLKAFLCSQFTAQMRHP